MQASADGAPTAAESDVKRARLGQVQDHTKLPGSEGTFELPPGQQSQHVGQHLTHLDAQASVSHQFCFANARSMGHFANICTTVCCCLFQCAVS